MKHLPTAQDRLDTYTTAGWFLPVLYGVWKFMTVLTESAIGSYPMN